jgi:hypothetical protein
VATHGAPGPHTRYHRHRQEDGDPRRHPGLVTCERDQVGWPGTGAGVGSSCVLFYLSHAFRGADAAT